MLPLADMQQRDDGEGICIVLWPCLFIYEYFLVYWLHILAALKKAIFCVPKLATVALIEAGLDICCGPIL